MEWNGFCSSMLYSCFLFSVHHSVSNYSNIEKLLMRAVYLGFYGTWMGSHKRNFLTAQYGYYVTNFSNINIRNSCLRNHQQFRFVRIFAKIHRKLDIDIRFFVRSICLFAHFLAVDASCSLFDSSFIALGTVFISHFKIISQWMKINHKLCFALLIFISMHRFFLIKRWRWRNCKNESKKNNARDCEIVINFPR